MQKIKNKELFRVKEYIPKETKKIVIVFTAMGTKIWMYKLFIHKMNKAGFGIIIFDYPVDFVLYPNLNKWAKFFENILSEAKKRIEKNKNDNISFYAYGASMGTLLAIWLTTNIKEIEHVVLNLVYGDVAENIFHCKLVKKAKLGFQSQNIDEQKLRENIRYMDPIVNAIKLTNKKVFYQAAKRDRVLVYDQTKFTHQAFKKHIFNYTYQLSKHGGHWRNGIKNLMNTKKIIEFFNR